jgi:hypothetical protein
MINKVKRFREIVNAMADLYEKKNSNYGDSFGKLFHDLGPTSGLVPLHNKLDRLTSLIAKSDKNNFESVEDTLKDLACYAIMNLIETEIEKEKGSTITKSWIDDNDWLQKSDYSIQTIPNNPCDNCIHKSSSNLLTGIVGDTVCDFCQYNPYKITCTGSVTSSTKGGLNE